MKSEYEEKIDVGYKFENGDFEATNYNLAILSSVSFFGGFASSFSGISPAIVFGPTLIYLGVEPQVATSTSMYIAMFTTMISTI